ncbi:MAG TPA: addiction module antidote protein [Chitinispirillaceae bacterium]|nr:addiction module antidote protein [Chitinispirillaceae bacterium]
MDTKITDLDISEYLDTEESIASYLSSIMEDGDPQLLLSAISDVAKARGMAKIASDSGLGRESLYKALKPESKPRFETILKVLNSLGVKIQFNAIHEIGGKNEKSKKKIKSVKTMKTRKKTVPRGGSRKTKNISEKVK